MTAGTRVVRVSLRSDEGKEGERGTIRRTYTGEDGKPHCYSVEWDETHDFKTRFGVVAAWRVVTVEEWERKQKELKPREVTA